jgi:hypothetical protein
MAQEFSSSSFSSPWRETSPPLGSPQVSLRSLRAAIEDDINAFKICTSVQSPFPNIDDYQEIISANDLDCQAIEETVSWISTLDYSDVTYGFLSIIKGFLNAKQSELQFQEVFNMNKCICCFEMLGNENHRQLCMKTFCPLAEERLQHYFETTRDLK